MDLFDRAALKAKIQAGPGADKKQDISFERERRVGKSTVAVHLSVALADRGLQVGLLDVDLPRAQHPPHAGTGRPAGGSQRWGANSY